MLNAQQLAEYLELGFTVFDASTDLSDKIEAARSEIHAIGRCFSEDFRSSSHESVVSANGKGFYKALRRSLIISRFATDPSLIDAALAIGVRMPILGPSGLRVDSPLEMDHEFGWHQDFPCILGSSLMPTFWIPLYNVNAANTIRVMPGSHKAGLLRHVARGKGGLNLVVSPELVEELQTRYTDVALEVNAGQVVAMSGQIVHRTYYAGVSGPPRYTVILRFDDVGDRSHILLGLKTSDSGFNIVNSPEYSVA